MTDRIDREVDLPALPERVWRSLTESALLSGWLADEVRLELRPGGAASFRLGEEWRSGWVEEVNPPARDREPAVLTFWWGADGETASRVQLSLLETERGTTRLRIVETRPLEVLDLVGIPLPRRGGARSGPALVAA